MSCIFSLDEPLLEQQSVIDLFKGAEESIDIKVSLDKLCEVARIAIVSELLDSGKDESELLDIKLTFIDPPSSEELPVTMQAKASAQAGDLEINDRENLIEQQLPVSGDLPVSEEFLRRLAYRLDEVAVNSKLESERRSHLLIDFVSGAFGTGRCCQEGGVSTYLFKADGTTCDTKTTKRCIPSDVFVPPIE
jgi:hypothetical protein